MILVPYESVIPIVDHISNFLIPALRYDNQNIVKLLRVLTY